MAGRSAAQRARPEYFTGRVRLSEAARAGRGEATRVFDVRFYAGARTKLHSHTGPQVLVATAGAGSLVTYRRAGSRIVRVSRTRLSPGTAAYIPAGQLHTHGSTSAARTFSHVAVNLPARAGRESEAAWYDSDLATYATRI